MHTHKSKNKDQHAKNIFQPFFLTFSPILSIISPFYTGCSNKKKREFCQFLRSFFEKNFFSNLKKKMTFMGVILCEKSIPRIPESWKCFPDSDSGDGVGVLNRKSNIFEFLWENRRFLGFSRRGIDCAHSRTMKTLPWPWFRKKSKNRTFKNQL